MPHIETQTFKDDLQQHFPMTQLSTEFNETTIVVAKQDYLPLLTWLKTDDYLQFEQLIDLCAVDYQEYPQHSNQRFAVVLHLLSVRHNQRIRVKAHLSLEDLNIDSVSALWTSANWYEREAFDLMGIIFNNHNDLRRILTDYDFIGHPLRKDFPTSGFVEMKYDEAQARVVYQPITIEPREITPRIIREENYAKS